jgi:hypothetical protein
MSAGVLAHCHSEQAAAGAAGHAPRRIVVTCEHPTSINSSSPAYSSPAHLASQDCWLRMTVASHRSNQLAHCEERSERGTPQSPVIARSVATKQSPGQSLAAHHPPSCHSERPPRARWSCVTRRKTRSVSSLRAEQRSAWQSGLLFSSVPASSLLASRARWSCITRRSRVAWFHTQHSISSASFALVGIPSGY